MRFRRKPTYHELEFDVELQAPEDMHPTLKEDMCAMWCEVLFDILEEA